MKFRFDLEAKEIAPNQWLVHKITWSLLSDLGNSLGTSFNLEMAADLLTFAAHELECRRAQKTNDPQRARIVLPD